MKSSLILIFSPKKTLHLFNADVAATPTSTSFQLHFSVSRLIKQSFFTAVAFLNTFFSAPLYLITICKVSDRIWN